MRPSRFWLSIPLAVIAWGAVLAALLLPPGGAGIPLCFSRLATRLPCPGCGMTRSFIALADGRFADAFAFHPLGPPFFALFCAVAAASLLPRAARRRLADRLDAHPRTLNALLYLIFFVWAGHGLVRAIAYAAGSPSVAAVCAHCAGSC